MDLAEAQAIYDRGRDACVAVLVDLAGRCGRLEQRVAGLEEGARKSSRNSSTPPSQDPPKTRAQRRAEARKKAKEWSKRDGEKRRQGAQAGHRGAGRRLLPEEQVDEVVRHYPDACRDCGREFLAGEKQPGGRFGRHQVADLPPVAVMIVEHRTQHLTCPGCGKSTAARLPAEIAGSPFGAGLQAAIVTLTTRNRVSRRDLPELLEEILGVKVSSGTVERILKSASHALEQPHEKLVDRVISSPVLNIDETGWYTAYENRTMWSASTPRAAVFKIMADRHQDRLKELIGESFDGIVGSDRWWAYELLDVEHRQACWEHLKRDFYKHSQGLAEQGEFGAAGLALTLRLFKAWHAFGEHQDRKRLAAEIAPTKAELRKLLEHAGRKSPRTRRHRRFANNLLKIWPALWTFVTVNDVEPTNNSAERSLRGPVIYRKLSHGTQNDEGERFIERALSVSVTCRLQARSMFAYMRELLTAQARGDPLPTLA